MLCLLHLLLPPSSNSFSRAQPRDEARLWGSCCEAGGSKPSFTPSSASVGQGVFPVSRQVPHGVCWESGPMEDPPQCSQDRDLSESPISQQVPQCHLEHRPTGVPSCPRESPQRPQDRNTPSVAPHPSASPGEAGSPQLWGPEGRVPSGSPQRPLNSGGSRGQGTLSGPRSRPQPEAATRGGGPGFVTDGPRAEERRRGGGGGPRGPFTAPLRPSPPRSGSVGAVRVLLYRG